MPKTDVLQVVVSWNGNSFDSVRDALVKKMRKTPISSMFSLNDMTGDITFSISKRRANNFFERVHRNMREIRKQYGIGLFCISMFDYSQGDRQ